MAQRWMGNGMVGAGLVGLALLAGCSAQPVQQESQEEPRDVMEVRRRALEQNIHLIFVNPPRTAPAPRSPERCESGERCETP